MSNGDAPMTSNTITTVTSPRGFRARFDLMARAGELSIIGEPIPEVAVETSRKGYGSATRERAQRVIERAVRMGWAVTQVVGASEAEAGKTDAHAPWGRCALALPEWTLHRCAGPSCPGLPYRASEIAHPASCALHMS